MRRTGTILIVLIVSIAATATAVALPSSGGKATGGEFNVTENGLNGQRSFTAEGTPTSAKGQVEDNIVDPAGVLSRHWHGVVDCYYQQGNQAWFSGQITNSQTGLDREGNYFLWAVQDNGEGSTATGPDLFHGFRSQTPFDCSNSGVVADLPVQTGNIQVH